MSYKYKASIIFVGLFVLVPVAFAGSSLAQSSNPSQPAISRDIEVMKGIISTTLSYENGDRRSRGPYVVGWEASGVEGFYLRGQGAVFTIRVPQTPELDLPRLEGVETRLTRLERGESRELMRAQLQLLQAQVEQFEDQRRAIEEHRAEMEALAPSDVDLAFDIPPAPEPPEPPAPAVAPVPAVAPTPASPPAPPAPAGARGSRSQPELTDRDVTERVAEMQKRLQEVKEKQAQARAEAEERRQSLETALIDVFARHGDSMPEVGVNEHINFVLIGSNEPGVFFGNSLDEQTVEILSVKVSDVRELKAGRISRSEFDSRIQKY